MSQYVTLVKLLDSQKENLASLVGTFNNYESESLSNTNLDNLLQRKLISDAIVEKQNQILDTKIKIAIIEILCGTPNKEGGETDYSIAAILSFIFFVLFIVIIVLIVNKFTD